MEDTRLNHRIEQIMALCMKLSFSNFGYVGKFNWNRDFNISFVELRFDDDKIFGEKIAKLRAELVGRVTL